MLNFDYITKENIKEHNPKWPETPDHPYRILIVGGSGSGKTNAFEAKHQLIINKRESASLKYLNDPKAFTEYSNDMDDI